VGLGDFGNPSFLGRRQQHINASAETVVRFRPVGGGDEAGMAAFQNDEYWYLLAAGLDNGRPVIRLKRRAGPREDAKGVVIASAPLSAAPGAPIYLRIVARGGAYDFYYGQRAGQWLPLARDVDGTILSTKVAGGFVGAVFGPYAYAGTPASR
jgi:alpha-N-arabinofuranosidase